MSAHVTPILSRPVAAPPQATQPHSATWTTNSGATVSLLANPGKRTNVAQMFEIQRILTNAEAEIARHLNRL